MKSNNGHVQNLIEKHILDCVYSDTEETYSNIKDACLRLKSEFERVANYPSNLHNLPNEQIRFSDYLNGLPFHFEYENVEIEKFLNNLGINPTNKSYPYDQQLKQYHFLIYSVMNKTLKTK